MKLHQLSLFLENRPGQIRAPIRLLAEAGVNILSLSLADTQEFGILRLIVHDWQRARSVLEQVGRVVNVTEVVAIEVPDRPGGLDEVLAVVEEAGLNIEYMYSMTFHRRHRAVLVLRFEDLDAATAALRARNLSVLDPVDLCGGPAG